MKLFLSFIVLAIVSSCLPKPPGSALIKSKEIIGENSLELYQFQREELSNTTDFPPRKKPVAKKNLIFVALDETVQPQYESILMDVYKTDQVVRLEDVSFWKFSKRFKGLYDHVIRIPHNKFHIQSLREALKVAEKLGKPYDLFLLTHGIPNNLTTVSGEPFISYEEIGELKEIVSKLDFVYLQSCFGNTLFRDFKALGAKAMVGFSGWNRNFFFVDFFLKRYKRYKGDAQKAFEKSFYRIESDLKRSILYKKILEAMGMTVEDYLASAGEPIFSSSVE